MRKPASIALRQGRQDPDDTVAGIRLRLRTEILSRELPPGMVLSQVQLARRFGVSRTPLREALRMLQEEGLIEAEHNRRARVAGFDSGDLELVYANRILLSAVATALSVPRMTDADLMALGAAFEEARECSEGGDAELWRRADRAFHRAHTLHAPENVLREIDQLHERASLYRALWLRDEAQRQPMTTADHEAILEACRARDPDAAVEGVARHLSRIALTLMASTMPEREPSVIRAALQLALSARFSRS
jgi:DNA-binding GntR family transcriptional regulator